MLQTVPDPTGLALSTELRVVVSVATLFLAGLTSYVAIPWSVDETGTFITEQVLRSERVPYDANRVRWFVPKTLAVRTLQLAVTVAEGLVLLAVWGYAETATTVAAFLYSTLDVLSQVIGTLLLLGVLMAATDILEQKVHEYAEETDRVNEHEEGVVFRVLQATLIVTVALVALALWDYDLRGLLVGAGFLGIVFGMAAQHTLGNMIAGFVLMFSRPFEIGDWVRIEDSEGTVTDITIMHTRIRTFDGETVVYPNDLVNKSRVTNYSDRNRLRLTVDVTVDYETDLDRACEVALSAVGGVEEVLDVPSPEVASTTFGDSGIALELRFWIENPSARKRRRVVSEAVQAVKTDFEAEGIDIPYPHQTVVSRTDEDPEAVDASVPTE